MAIETHTEIDALMERIEKLPLNAQLQLVELVTRHIRESISSGTSTERLKGILDLGDPPPTKDEIREMYTDYLEEKYR